MELRTVIISDFLSEVEVNPSVFRLFFFFLLFFFSIISSLAALLPHSLQATGQDIHIFSAPQFWFFPCFWEGACVWSLPHMSSPNTKQHFSNAVLKSQLYSKGHNSNPAISAKQTNARFILLRNPHSARNVDLVKGGGWVSRWELKASWELQHFLTT